MLLSVVLCVAKPGAAGVNEAQAADASVFPISFVTDAKYTYVSSLGWSLK
jgi:hypothetical protein